jgi:hypothetical protein
MKGSLKAQLSSVIMHIDSCPKCGSPGYMIKTYRKIEAKVYGPYLVVQHYVSKSKKGTTKVRPCFISLKKLHPEEKTRVGTLLAREEENELLSRGERYMNPYRGKPHIRAKLKKGKSP